MRWILYTILSILGLIVVLFGAVALIAAIVISGIIAAAVMLVLALKSSISRRFRKKVVRKDTVECEILD